GVNDKDNVGDGLSTTQGSIGASAADNFGPISDEAKAMASKFLDPSKRFKEYRRIGNELIDAGQSGAGEWFLLAADQVEAIALGFEGGTGMLALLPNGGSGSVNAMFVIQDASYRLSQYNFQNYLDIKNTGSIKGLEGLRGKQLAIEMAGFEQQVAQRVFNHSLSMFSPSSRSSIVNNINERFNGWFDRAVGGVSPGYVSNSIRVLDRLYPNQNFRFDNQQHRLNLAIGLIDDQFARK
ncbi:hypothetical protein, partial [Aliikangiella maris]